MLLDHYLCLQCFLKLITMEHLWIGIFLCYGRQNSKNSNKTCPGHRKPGFLVQLCFHLESWPCKSLITLWALAALSVVLSRANTSILTSRGQNKGSLANDHLINNQPFVRMRAKVDCISYPQGLMHSDRWGCSSNIQSIRKTPRPSISCRWCVDPYLKVKVKSVSHLDVSDSFQPHGL